MTVYIFGGTKEQPNWHFTKCKLNIKPYIGWDREAKKLYCNFIADHSYHCGAFYVLSLNQLIVLPFKHRLYFSERRAKARQSKNYRSRNIV